MMVQVKRIVLVVVMLVVVNVLSHDIITFFVAVCDLI
jgi:hypothetical protein